jgi:IS30 family transposase
VSKLLIELLKPRKDRIHTFTSDNGTEFARNAAVSVALGCRYYFAKPYHSWERGSNENYNGFVRDYFPKQIEYYDIIEEEVKAVEKALSTRPRKRNKFYHLSKFLSKNITNLTPIAFVIRIRQA